jgi:hypothetical protein
MYILGRHMTPLRTALDAVVDEPSFIAFLNALAEDWELERGIEQIRPSSAYGAGARGWENGTIGAFLERAAAWAEDSSGGLPGVYDPPSNPWRRCADIIYMGKIYE